MRPALALALLLAVPLASPARADDSLKAGLALAFQELDAWDVAGARRLLDELAARAPDDPGVVKLQAQVLFEEARYADAQAALQRLGGQADVDFAALVQGAGKVTRAMETRESANFVVAYRPGPDAVLVPYALETLEKQRAALVEQLGYAPPGKVRIEFVQNARELAMVSTLPLEAIKKTGTIAICKFNRLMVTTPRALLRGYEWQDTLAHEFTHLVISKMSRDAVPIWIHEGLAKFLESSWRGAPGQGSSPAAMGLLAEALKQNKLIPFERMHPSMALLPSQEDAALAYAIVFTVVEYLHGKGGYPVLRRIIENLKAGERYDLAVGKAVGTPFNRVVSDWMAYLAKREFPRETLPLSVEKLRFKDDEAKRAADKSQDRREEIRFGDFLEIEDAEGRKLAHLGELMRQRNRFPAAADAFARAHARVGNRSPALSNKYAQTLIKTGDLVTAEQLLLASLKPFPGHPSTHANLAAIYLATRRPMDAERSFLEVIGVNPFDPAPHEGLAKIYKERQDESRAQRELEALRILAGEQKQASDEGTLVVRSHPWARVFLDGADTQRTTPTQLRVKPGAHKLKLVNDELGLVREESVEVATSEEKAVEVLLDGPGPAPASPGTPPAQP